MNRCELDRIQHVQAKVLASVFDPSCLDVAIAVFHRWIQLDACEELLVDVADYRHLPVGPAIILVGHEANYCLDRTHGRPGLLYARKTVLKGSLSTRILYSMRQAFLAARRLAEEPELRGKLAFDYSGWEIVFNDRLLAPNTDASWSALGDELRRLLSPWYSGDHGQCSLQRLGEPRDLLRIGLQLPVAEDHATRLEKFLASAG
ncbi:MAG: hypothetical protein ACP5U2_02100 [Bryobacteraceae bacterium]